MENRYQYSNINMELIEKVLSVPDRPKIPYMEKYTDTQRILAGFRSLLEHPAWFELFTKMAHDDVILLVTRMYTLNNQEETDTIFSYIEELEVKYNVKLLKTFGR